MIDGSKPEVVIVCCLYILSEIASVDDIKYIENLLNHSFPEVRATVCKVLEKKGILAQLRN